MKYCVENIAYNNKTFCLINFKLNFRKTKFFRILEKLLVFLKRVVKNVNYSLIKERNYKDEF